MKRALKFVRSGLRFAVALLFWLNALFIFRVTPLHLAPVGEFLHLETPEITVLFFLTMAAVLSTYGLGSVAFDIFYIYFFPFVLVYYLIRISIKLFVALYKAVWGEPPLEKWPPKIGFPAVVIQQTPTTSQNVVEPAKPTIVARLTRVFRHFTLLWCALIVVAARPSLLWIAVIVVLIHIGSTLLTIFQFVWQSSNWLGDLENRIKVYADGLIKRAVEAAEITEDLRNVWSGLVGLQLAVNILNNRRRVIQWAILITVLAVAIIYIYVGILFSFGYYGVARLESITIRWRDLAVISLFMPLSYTNLPKSAVLGLLGGVHSIWILLLGAGTIIGYLRKKWDSIYDTTLAVSVRLQQEDLRAKLGVMTEKFQVKTPPASGSVSTPEKPNVT